MDDSFYRVYTWMTKDLGLRGTERDLFALIYSFTEAGGQMTGGLQYLCRRTGASRTTVMEGLRKLLVKDLLVKTVKTVNGVRYCEYRANEARLAALLPGQISLPEGQKPSHPGQETVPGEGRKPSHPGQETVLGEGRKPSHPGQETAPGWAGNLTGPGQETVPNTKEYTKENTKENTKECETPARQSYQHYGEYGNVLLTREELELLRKEYPDDWQQRINRLSEYMASTGKRYRSHLATIRSWARQDAPKEEKKGRFADLKGGLVL